MQNERVRTLKKPGKNLELKDDLLLQGDAAEWLDLLPKESFDMIYIDPPFNTGKKRNYKRLSSKTSETGHKGFAGKRYKDKLLSEISYDDKFDDFLSWIEPNLQRAHNLLSSEGTLYLHLDYREAHGAKLLLDKIFGEECFLNEIIWAYDFGGRAKNRWPAKHDTILVYVKDPKKYHFDSAEVDREPYMAPGLQTPERAKKGKLPTDVWWHTIVTTSGKERTGYPTQKPEGIVRRAVLASSKKGGWCLDFFAGSGTLGAVCKKEGRHFVLVDSNPDAIPVIQKRLKSSTRR